MFIKLQDTYINPEHISLVSLRNEGKTLVIDLAYSKADDPVFVTFHYDTPEEARAAVDLLISHV